MIIGTVIYILTKIGVFTHAGLIVNHGNDFICGYIFSYLVAFLYQLILRNKISIGFLLLAILIASWYWEIIYPIFDKESISDFYDFIAYIMGFTLYAVINELRIFKIELVKRRNKMYCKKCGNEIEEGQLFCSSCGNRIKSTFEVKKEDSDSKEINDSDGVSKEKVFEIPANVYMSRHMRNFNTIVTIKNKNVKIESLNYTFKKGKPEVIRFTIDEIESIKYKTSLVMDWMTKLRFCASALCFLLGFVLPPAFLFALLLLGMNYFMAMGRTLTIKLKSGTELKIFYNSKKQTYELFDALT
ncbi:hypothetical protein EROP_10410 [Erysipelotrichaceae bacterium OPF54]|uniref:zinc ribbon domain-containing protein n=3 Tax=uncultured Dubosiella sp. TaxID=1937011 RepID=UPI00208B1EE2|nr:zinc ribbon domain-containing protein [uncultured Dubosiella sp.]GJM57348.1 hypothetical protein EROP_10410 [Erysipelotrichaceae bacterium OPF54]